MRISCDHNFIIADHTILSYIHDWPMVDVPAKVNDSLAYRIGNGAFMGYRHITDVKVAEGIREIGHRAFADCSGLKSVSIPKSVVSIEPDAFEGTNLSSISFWLRIPYSKYVTIRDGSIHLTDGRFIVDPKALGGREAALIHSFIPKASGDYAIDRRMGCLYTTSDTARKITFAFADYCEENDINPKDLRSDKKAVRIKILNKDSNQWIGRSIESSSIREPKLQTTLLLCTREGTICDSDIRLQFELIRGVFYFERCMKIRWNGADYLYECKEYLINDAICRFYRDACTFRVFDSMGNEVSNSTLERDIRHKMSLFE